MSERIVNKILIFAGTTEGRCLAEKLLDLGTCCHVCVATAYGQVVMDTHPNLIVHTGRLDEEGMIELMQSEDFLCVIDATHPFAVKVSESVRLSADKAG
ncbi:MAG: precorrin-6A/cobalt-precorrin-6A reductase, partial [Lachnospiraceae bacterium]|nr:precorrin-6A/cobalt-precorrin-6A reductase [Candidatus Equihabitans merdae]